MKTLQNPKTSPLFKEIGEQPVRLIKAAQASKVLGGTHRTHNHGPIRPLPANHEIRMIHAGGRQRIYCDLEVVCGCGESTSRCVAGTRPLHRNKSCRRLREENSSKTEGGKFLFRFFHSFFKVMNLCFRGKTGKNDAKF